MPPCWSAPRRVGHRRLKFLQPRPGLSPSAPPSPAEARAPALARGFQGFPRRAAAEPVGWGTGLRTVGTGGVEWQPEEPGEGRGHPGGDPLQGCTRVGRHGDAQVAQPAALALPDRAPSPLPRRSPGARSHRAPPREQRLEAARAGHGSPRVEGSAAGRACRAGCSSAAVSIRALRAPPPRAPRGGGGFAARLRGPARATARSPAAASAPLAGSPRRGAHGARLRRAGRTPLAGRRPGRSGSVGAGSLAGGARGGLAAAWPGLQLDGEVRFAEGDFI